MIKFRNHIGTIGISTGYLRQLISDTAESCFGVAGLNAYGAKQGQDGDELIVDLHITVNYGINVGAIVDSIIHKVNYVLTEQAGVNVKSVNVYVDEMKG